jgi:hypothetical protein
MELVVEWIHLAQDRDQWWALVNTVMNFWVTQNVLSQSERMTDQVSHPYSTTSKITVLYILIFSFLI